MKKEEILAIVIAYNIEEKIILQNINSYKNYVDKVIIVDNSDKENKLNELSDEKIAYLKLNDNLGIAKALNEGIYYAIKHNYKFVLTMDQDSKFNNNLIEEYSKNYGKDIIIYSPNYIIERKHNKEYKVDSQYLYWTMTSGNLINLELFQKVGMFKEEFFIDGVDYEYCLRARKNGYKILQCNKAILLHNPGITKIKKILFWNYKYGYMSPTRMYYQIRNLKYISKEYKSFRAELIIIIKFLKIVLLFDNKKEFFTMFKKGIKDCKENKFGKIESKE